MIDDFAPTPKTANPWPIGGYAPGKYYCYCSHCGRKHIADKRASSCVDCAVDLLKREYMKLTAPSVEKSFIDVRKKPVTVQAVLLTKENVLTVHSLITSYSNNIRFTDEGIVIPTLEGDMLARFGDYIIKGVNGEFYPCKAHIFQKTYEVPND